jgi:hypothetical protein
MPTFTTRAVFNPTRSAAASAAPATHSTTGPQPCCCPACVGLECLDRTRYFSGQLLTEADLNNDQSYWLAKNRLHNRFLHGWGVVCGMQVVCGCDGWVTVKTGYAIDPCGNDIIVCADQPFNVAKAIQACCTPAKPSDCSPLRAAPPPNCQDAQQKWCITIQYEEQPSRPVTPLRQATSGCGCGCGASSKGGCGCGGSGTSTSSGSACCCSSTQSLNPASTTPGCEPTRILEGFKLGVCPAPSDYVASNATVGKPSVSRTIPCIQALSVVIQQKPTFSATASDAVNYSTACNYLALVRKTVATGLFTNCQTIGDLNGLQVPKPDGDNYTAALQGVVDRSGLLLVQLAKDCLCLALLPTCPSDPCTNCLVLACVTIQNGTIIDICHFGGGRRQVVTFPALGYWLSLIGFDSTFTTLTQFLEAFCCAEGNLDRLVLPGLAQADNVSTNGFSNPALVNRMLSAALSGTLGATVVNAITPSARALDLRPFVGLTQAEVAQMAKSNKMSAHFVEVGSAWLDTSASAGQQFTPSAFPASQPLTVYTSSGTVVGFEATSPTDSLKLQIADLKQQIADLQNHTGLRTKTPVTKPSNKG